MKNKLSRRKFGKVAGGITAAAAITSPMSLMKNAFAAENLSVVDWGPPWIDNTKKLLHHGVKRISLGHCIQVVQHQFYLR